VNHHDLFAIVLTHNGYGSHFRNREGPPPAALSSSVYDPPHLQHNLFETKAQLARTRARQPRSSGFGCPQSPGVPVWEFPHRYAAVSTGNPCSS
jgi:hypothetical protein